MRVGQLSDPRSFASPSESCSNFGMSWESRVPAQSRLLVRLRARRFLASGLFRRRCLCSLFGRLFDFLVDRLDLHDRLVLSRDRGYTLWQTEVTHPDGIAGANELRDIDVDLMRNARWQRLHLDLGANLGQHTVDGIARIVEGNWHDRAHRHQQVRCEEVDMKR